MNYKVDNLKNYQDRQGWICGHFFSEESIQKNSDMEVNVNTFEPGFTAPRHFHPKSKMVLFVTEGKIKFRFGEQEHILSKNDFAYLEEGVHEEVVEVLEKTTMLCVRTPSVPDNSINV